MKKNRLSFDYIFTHLEQKQNPVVLVHRYKKFLDDYGCVKFRVTSREYKPIDVTDEKEEPIGVWCNYSLTIKPIIDSDSIDKYYTSIIHRLECLQKETIS